jgi:hypothetical protein
MVQSKDHKIISPLQGFVWEESNRRLRFATPPVMHITPHAGLRKMFFDKFIMSFLPIMRNISY